MTVWDVVIILLIGAFIFGVGCLLGGSIVVTAYQNKQKKEQPS